MVTRAISELWCDAAPARSMLAIGDRVAEQLTGPWRLSEEDREMLLRLLVPGRLFATERAALRRLLDASSACSPP